MESVENKICDIFIQRLVFNEINQLILVGYELTDSLLSAPHLFRYLKTRIQRAFLE